MFWSVAKMFWIVAIAITCLNAYSLRSRGQKEVDRNPELAEGYARLFKGYLILINLPWLVMGLGILVGSTRDVFDYLDPRAGNVYVMLFHITTIVLYALGAYWVYFAGGAEFLVRHPGAMNIDVKSPRALKLFYGLMLLGGMVAEVAMWLLRPP